MIGYNNSDKNRSVTIGAYGRSLARATAFTFLFSKGSSASFVGGKSAISGRATSTPFNENQNMAARSYDGLFGSNFDMDGDSRMPSTAVSKIRRSFLVGALLTSTASGSVAQAAIPTIDDYETTTTGAVIKPKGGGDSSANALVKDLGRKQSLSAKTDVEPFSEELVKSLGALQGLVDQADWVSVRSVLRGEAMFEGNALSVCRKPYFGLKGGEKGFIKVMVGGSDITKLENSREDLAFSLSELEDFALENRSIFFNSVDRKQVDELISESGFKENLAEGRNLFAVVKRNAVNFQKVASQF